ncbi:hypothetical protein BG004_004992 [Podila humilis]|nr:hypothetical protein BG004_004992 [Podila humilis]
MSPNNHKQEQLAFVTRKPFVKNNNRQYYSGPTLAELGVARTNVAATPAHPTGTLKDNWARNHSHETVLQQHCSFFDRDNDGVIWPIDTVVGFYELGFNILFSLLSTMIIHSSFSYPTSPTWLPDPFFRIWTRNIHKDKHGSDSGTYDPEGRFVPQHFEDIFAKYGTPDQDGLTYRDLMKALKGQRVVMDPFGWFGAFFEWSAAYLLLWPEDGVMRKEDIRRIYDGSIFPEIAAKNKKAKMQA